MLANDHDGGWRRAGGIGAGCPGLTQGLYIIVNALPQSKRDELRVHCRWKQTPIIGAYLSFSLHPGALTVIGGGPDTPLVPRSHSVTGPQCQHQPRPEPAQSEGHCPVSIVFYDGPPLPLTAALVVPSHKYMISCERGQSDAGKK